MRPSQPMPYTFLGHATRDLSLAGFIVAAAPHAQKKCAAAGCGDGVTAHVRTFLHADARVTLSIATLPAGEALPGEERGQIWLWVRPKGGVAEAAARQVRRHGAATAELPPFTACPPSPAGPLAPRPLTHPLPLSPEASCLSFGAFLHACFNATALEAGGRPLHSGFVRYFGLGRTVMCLHQDHIHPSDVVLPGVPLRYSLNAQLMWLKQEAAELCQAAWCPGIIRD
ncbi:1-phosphatidylinositol-4-phosphate5-kinase [Monoraphidium neglectum]|uniref:1-phosphatidylinositol-4-phosphate5-kinase n=1 Tax=Monoraphidium neglectum TaxID=145388 RepID=A0A0D2LP97_9CHLO|nr:1-phosphatidylinositol-4-phosphate5-kinase [Monoraphidium neglectum]KIY91826.1 1-phosphatidylinositol-4-phosphate5-kinase [Monoraphidium neglectum]|eukprot:XP_013890846.1 1-phosphatidylinositol-4-phosphate5-kinase [Monoraphidium neglectum]